MGNTIKIKSATKFHDCLIPLRSLKAVALIEFQKERGARDIDTVNLSLPQLGHAFYQRILQLNTRLFFVLTMFS